MSSAFVSIIMGSDSDLPIMQACIDTLKKLDITCEVKISSAHRTPDITRNYIADAEQRGCQVFIGAAGLAAHLAGTIAAHTLKPVIGVPMDGGPLKGMDALLSTVQMPSGIPVATVAIGKAGAKNAAYLAAQMMALKDDGIAKRLTAEREENALAVVAADAKVQKSL